MKYTLLIFLFATSLYAQEINQTDANGKNKGFGKVFMKNQKDHAMKENLSMVKK